MRIAAGSRLGPYEITAAIGAGGMGEVFRARDTKLNRDVAIKVLPEAFAQDHERVARFKREAQVLASLNHPNIAAIYGFEEGTAPASTTPVIALILELVEGEDLAHRLKRGAIPTDEAIAVARQIAEGLEEAHEHGVVHRDLKPANIKLTSDGKVKVLDFGLAKAFTNDGSNSGSRDISHSPTMTHPATDAGMILGTAAYMSPEQARGKAVDRRADIWSFGVVLFEILSGRRLFSGETVSDTLAAVLRQDVDWSLLPKDLLPSHRRLIERCLERDPKKRLRDIGEARLALEGADSGTRATTAAAIGVSNASHGRRRSRGFLIPAAVAIAAAVLGLTLGRASVRLPKAPTFTPRTYVAQAIFSARFMPDGQTMIISSALTGNSPSLFESRPGAAAPRPFGPPRTHLLSISKSGELAVLTNVSYLSQRQMRGTLARMSVDGAPRAIAEDVREADWLPDGSDLAVIRETGGRDQLEFPVGHVVRQVPGYLSDPRVSHDGTRVAFMEHPIKFDNRGYVMVVDRAGKVTTVAGEFSAEEGIAWSLDDRSVLFSAASESRDLSARRVNAMGGDEPVPLLSSAGTLYVHDIASDGRMAMTREDYRLGVVARGALQQAERDLTPLDKAWTPRLSADGRFVVFGDGHGGNNYAATLRNVDGSPPATLGEGNPSDISKDDRWVTATLFSTGRCVVYPTGAGKVVSIELGPLQACQSAVWFPDGKSLLITGNEPGRPTRAYRATFPGGKPEALLPEGLSPQGISPNGLRVLVRNESQAWQMFEIGGAPPSAAKGLLPGDLFVEWGDDEATLVVADTRTFPASIQQVRLGTGLRTKLGELAPADRAGLISVVPSAYRDGGRQYAYSYGRRVSTLYLVGAER